MAAEHTFELRTETITLGNLLKATGIASNGGEAKFMVQEGGILVNGEPEDRRGRQLSYGDVVLLPDGQKIVLS